MKTKLRPLTLAIVLVALGCEQNDSERQVLQAVDDSPVFMDLSSIVSDPNGRVKKRSSAYALLMAEYFTASESGQVGRTIFFMDVGNKQLGADFVPGLNLDGTDDISYYIDEKRSSNDLPVATTSQAIGRAMSTWDGITCSELGMYQVPSANIKTGFVAQLLGFNGSYDYVADVVHCGWLPGSFFDLLAPDGSEFILGVTFTIIFTDDNGEPVDTNNDGKSDVAWREIYYNDDFVWKDGSTYDVETVALHESGHGLSQAHFGQAFLDGGSGALHFSPRAVMNAAYSGVQITIKSSDNAGHCSLWAEWPSN
jgi:hypothetical protein